MSDWLDRLRELHDSAFRYDWDARLRWLNERYAIEERSRFRTVASGLPPVLFNGDVEAIKPAAWTLVVSINPGANPLPERLYLDQFSEPEAFWSHWRTYNRDFVRTQSDFFPRLVDLARGILAERQSPDDRMEYATTRMVFVEIWPYSSPGWPPRQAKGAGVRWNDQEEDELFPTDRGVQLCTEITNLLLEQAAPALVLVNGRPSVRHFERLHAEQLSWRRIEYVSASDHRKTLWHMEGTSRGIPTIGFPQLRKARTHNSAAEIEQLTQAARSYLEIVRRV